MHSISIQGTGHSAAFVVYWREGRRQLFAFRSQVEARSPAEARRSFSFPRNVRPHVFGVKLRAPDGGFAASGRWVG